MVVYGLSPLISLGRSPTSPMAWRTKKRRSGGTPPACVALERVGRTDIEAEPLGVYQHLDEGCDVAHAEIITLARDGMEAVSRIAHQHQPRVDIALGMHQPEREPPAR